MKQLLLIIAAASMMLTTGTASAQSDDQGEGLGLWSQIHEVFAHPRCSNCHVGEDNIPLWSGEHYGGEARPHGMFISAGDSRDGSDGVPCSTCHTEQNSAVLHGPPGAHNWGLPPVEMQWAGRSSREICEQIKNPEMTGGRSVADVADHIDHDALVHWGWEPGPGREPAPFSKAELVGFILAWDALGAPCPE